MPAPKFNFVPEKQLGRDPGEGTYKVTLTKAGTLYFSPMVVNVYELDGKFMTLYGDVEKKCIAWKIISEDTTLPELHDSRQLKKNSAQGNVIVSVQKIIKKLGIPKLTEAKTYEVEIYKSAMLEDKLYYIQL